MCKHQSCLTEKVVTIYRVTTAKLLLFFYFNNFEWSLVITAGGLLLKVFATMYRYLVGSDEAKYLAGRILKYLRAETKKGCTKQPEEITCDYMFQ